MKFDLNNKVAIVTGASQGIGETIAVEMANSGAYVICLARNKDALDSTINIIEKNGCNHFPQCLTARGRQLDVLD